MLPALKTLRLTPQKKSFIIRFLGESVLTWILLLLAQNFFKIYGHVTKRGFFCDDESLKYPYHEDTVSSSVLITLTLVVPPFFVIVAEILSFVVLKKRKYLLAEDRKLTSLLLRLHHYIVAYYSCFAMQAFFVHLAKVSVGRLRPHFFQICQPYRKDNSTCADVKNHGVYIEDYECSTRNDPNVSERMLWNSHISFPSGHASYICYAMVFTIIYLQCFSERLKKYRINFGLLMIVLQMSCALLAWFVAVSRVMDYKHHWSDVLVGILLGSSVAIAVSLFVRQQLKSVKVLPLGVGFSNSHATTAPATATTTFATAPPNTFFVH